MNRILTIVLWAAATAAGLSACCGGASGCAESDPGAAAIETILTRTSIRAFTDQPVGPEQIETLLRAGMAAPSAVNRQPWAFVVLTERERLDQLREVHPNARMLATAQLAIVVCGDLEQALEGAGRDYWIQDASAAAENILLAAHALGLGAVWTGAYPSPARTAAISEILGLPGHVLPLCVIPVGYPAEDPAPKDKWKPEKVHYERW